MEPEDIAEGEVWSHSLGIGGHAGGTIFLWGGGKKETSLQGLSMEGADRSKDPWPLPLLTLEL